MKLVKKILRLLPFVFVLYSMLLPMFTRLPFDVSNYSLYGTLDYFGGNFDPIIEQFYNIFYNSLFEDINFWFIENVADSIFTQIAFGTLVYELYLSLLFLLFDFINMIFGWANKFINKGVDFD